MKKYSAFLIIGSVWLLPVTMPEVKAQQIASPQSAVTQTRAITKKELLSRRIAIEGMTDIDATIKAQSLDYIDRAINYLELADTAHKKTNELSQLIQTAPERVKLLQAELKKPFTESEKVETRAQQMSTLKIEQRLTQKEAELATAQSRLKEWSDRLAAEKAIINQTPENLAAATGRLKEIEMEVEALSDTDETDILGHSRGLSLKSEREYLSAEIKLNEQRQRSHNLLVELFSTEQDVARMVVKSREKMLKSWQTEVLNRRQMEAAQVREDAQDAMVEVPLMPKAVQDQFDINIQLSTELEEITREETTLAENFQAHQTQLKALVEDFETAKKRVESAVLTEAIGLALRSQRLNLPDAGQYFAESDDRKIRMSEISERQIEIDRMLREFSTPGALADSLSSSVSFLSDAKRNSLDQKIQDLAVDRLEIVHKLNSGYDRIFKLMQDIEFTEQKLVNTSEEFGELLDRHLLWIRSSKPVGFGDIQKLQISLGWFFKPVSWGQFFKDLGVSLRKRPFVWAFSLLIGLFLIFSRRWCRRKLKDIAESVEQQVEDSFLMTMKALGLTLILAAFYPFLLAFPAIQLTGLRSASSFSTGITGGLIYATRPLVFLFLFYNTCRQHGLAQAHFQWPESVRQIPKRNLGWFIPVVGLTSFFIGAMQTVQEFEYSDALAKLALLIQMIALSAFYALTLRFKGGITAVLIEKSPKNWLSRLRYVWYPLTILLPLIILYLAMTGYYYSAIEIRILVRDTIGLLIVLVILNHLVLRLLTLARRKIAWKKAKIEQLQRMEKMSEGESDSETSPATEDSSSLMESIMGMSAIDEQTRTLLRLSLYTIAIAGIWAIWEPALPALGILEDVHLWSYTTVINDTTQVVPITLANIVLSILVIAITFIAVRNLPGLLEMILLNRLPMDAGARYAYSTICRYTITAIGIVIALNSIGLQWSKLQWLIAALSVGLGFGLQEIVANFISGLIVLFERPFRVGDTVTIADVHGTVTRIRIRATTVEDWDRKELIVPNKEFITGRLINWSLSEHIIRIKLPVGIAYGSDTDLAEQLLYKVAKSNPMVLKSPAPQAVFLSFGDNSLNFELRVFVKNIDDWIPMLHAMNMAIDKEFRRAGITIAFPQRDVHLDAAGPLEVRVVSESRGPKPGKQPSAAPEGTDAY
ncbi:MAG: mechanosensitive ion channel [Deltaproteobacteria bacterium]|jgi:potassium efflux system protein|nr:mechanosensitive ion channel [Deltaproteobacteria bacterium]